MPRIDISFCTTCFDRAHQLMETFEANVAAIGNEPASEWVIVNFGSCDDLDAFVLDQLPRLPSRVRYARETSGYRWHASIAKNIAHRVGRGTILMNLDCDNFIEDSIATIQECFRRGCKALHMWSGVYRDGTTGRIALTNELFHRVGGYDESFSPMGYQDLDLLSRISALNLPIFHVPCSSNAAIRNSKVESIRHCPSGGVAWEDYDRMNREKSAANIAARKLIANHEKGWSEMHVTISTGLRD